MLLSISPTQTRIYTIVRARELNPEFPRIVGGLCWDVGREYCNPRNPKYDICPFVEFCKREVKSEIDIWT